MPRSFWTIGTRGFNMADEGKRNLVATQPALEPHAGSTTQVPAATPEENDRHIKALGFFKDFTNYLLVTTVAALGWITTSKALFLDPRFIPFCIFSFAGSIIFGIFTLALIPLVAEAVGTEKKPTFYDFRPESRPFVLWANRFPLQLVCWPQHVLFIAGIVGYSVGTWPGGH
jgi:hypothetical protein